MNVWPKLLQCHPEANLTARLHFSASTLSEPVQSNTLEDTLFGYSLRSEQQPIRNSGLFCGNSGIDDASANLCLWEKTPHEHDRTKITAALWRGPFILKGQLHLSTNNLNFFNCLARGSEIDV